MGSQSDSSFLLKLFKIVENRTDIVLRMLPTDIYLYQCISFNCVKTNKKHKTSTKRTLKTFFPHPIAISQSYRALAFTSPILQARQKLTKQCLLSAHRTGPVVGTPPTN